MAIIPLIAPNDAGQITMTAASGGGDEYANDQRTILLIQNAAASARAITITAQRTSVTVPAFGVLTIANIVVAMTGIGLAVMQASPGGYNNNTNGRADVTINTAASVSYAAIRLANVG